MKEITHDLNDLIFYCTHDRPDTQSIVCATVYGQCLEYLGYITLSGFPQLQNDDLRN